MKTKCKKQADVEMVKIMEGFTTILESTMNVDISLSATIKNVNLFDLLEMYNSMRGSKVRLAVPGEFYNDGHYIIVYAITHGVNIYIESEPVKKAIPNMSKLFYN